MVRCARTQSVPDSEASARRGLKSEEQGARIHLKKREATDRPAGWGECMQAAQTPTPPSPLSPERHPRPSSSTGVRRSDGMLHVRMAAWQEEDAYFAHCRRALLRTGVPLPRPSSCQPWHPPLAPAAEAESLPSPWEAAAARAALEDQQSGGRRELAASERAARLAAASAERAARLAARREAVRAAEEEGRRGVAAAALAELTRRTLRVLAVAARRRCSAPTAAAAAAGAVGAWAEAGPPGTAPPAPAARYTRVRVDRTVSIAGVFFPMGSGPSADEWDAHSPAAEAARADAVGRAAIAAAECGARGALAAAAAGLRPASQESPPPPPAPSPPAFAAAASQTDPVSRRDATACASPRTADISIGPHYPSTAPRGTDPMPDEHLLAMEMAEGLVSGTETGQWAAATRAAQRRRADHISARTAALRRREHALDAQEARLRRRELQHARALERQEAQEVAGAARSPSGNCAEPAADGSGAAAVCQELRAELSALQQLLSVSEGECARLERELRTERQQRADAETRADGATTDAVAAAAASAEAEERCRSLHAVAEEAEEAVAERLLLRQIARSAQQAQLRAAEAERQAAQERDALSWERAQLKAQQRKRVASVHTPPSPGGDEQQQLPSPAPAEALAVAQRLLRNAHGEAAGALAALSEAVSSALGAKVQAAAELAGALLLAATRELQGAVLRTRAACAALPATPLTCEVSLRSAAAALGLPDSREASLRSEAAGVPLPEAEAEAARQLSLRSAAAGCALPDAAREPSLRSAGAAQPLPDADREPSLRSLASLQQLPDADGAGRPSLRSAAAEEELPSDDSRKPSLRSTAAEQVLPEDSGSGRPSLRTAAAACPLPDTAAAGERSLRSAAAAEPLPETPLGLWQRPPPPPVTSFPVHQPLMSLIPRSLMEGSVLTPWTVSAYAVGAPERSSVFRLAVPIPAPAHPTLSSTRGVGVRLASAAFRRKPDCRAAGAGLQRLITSITPCGEEVRRMRATVARLATGLDVLHELGGLSGSLHAALTQLPHTGPFAPRRSSTMRRASLLMLPHVQLQGSMHSHTVFGTALRGPRGSDQEASQTPPHSVSPLTSISSEWVGMTPMRPVAVGSVFQTPYPHKARSMSPRSQARVASPALRQNCQLPATPVTRTRVLLRLLLRAGEALSTSETVPPPESSSTVGTLQELQMSRTARSQQTTLSVSSAGSGTLASASGRRPQLPAPSAAKSEGSASQFFTPTTAGGLEASDWYGAMRAIALGSAEGTPMRETAEGQAPAEQGWARPRASSSPAPFGLPSAAQRRHRTRCAPTAGPTQLRTQGVTASSTHSDQEHAGRTQWPQLADCAIGAQPTPPKLLVGNSKRGAPLPAYCQDVASPEPVDNSGINLRKPCAQAPSTGSSNSPVVRIAQPIRTPPLTPTRSSPLLARYPSGPGRESGRPAASRLVFRRATQPLPEHQLMPLPPSVQRSGESRPQPKAGAADAFVMWIEPRSGNRVVLAPSDWHKGAMRYTCGDRVRPLVRSITYLPEQKPGIRGMLRFDIGRGVCVPQQGGDELLQTLRRLARIAAVPFHEPIE
eukprot:TRINITY_DN480_c0_g1_i1.p1 TRINITY_DN480_c0_g1~~TRINITY_DN480_c0_g1_i1.p1  ORF type:complete len:1562 (+),score=330.65 TRINITY_DN480_c0_g1_i1:77-4762(+)